MKPHSEKQQSNRVYPVTILSSPVLQAYLGSALGLLRGGLHESVSCKQLPASPARHSLKITFSPRDTAPF
jgi:hypothetical protein